MTTNPPDELIDIGAGPIGRLYIESGGKTIYKRKNSK